MNVLFDDAAGPALAARFAALAADGLRVAICPPDDEAGYFDGMRTAEAMWHTLKPVTAAAIAAAPNLRLIQKIGAGVNTIAIEAAQARGVAVCNLPGSNARAVAEHALLLMLATLRRLPMLDTALRRGAWAVAPAMQDRFGELGGLTVGLVGYGAIPRLLAPMLVAMGCEVLYTARAPHEDAVGRFRRLSELLAESDIVSLHIPLTPETRHTIDRAALRGFRPGAILINTARGGLVDQAALLDALDHGPLAAAGLDVFETEPVDAADPLLSRDDVVVTPHIGWLTPQTWGRSLDIAVANLRRLAAGEPLLHRVA
jgi:phosphoglycerate dehydrogenase-like enzyme